MLARVTSRELAEWIAYYHLLVEEESQQVGKG